MKIPVLRGVIDRRMLVNFHADPDVLARQLPAPFRPKLVGGMGLVGICLIRLKSVRPRLVPTCFGLNSENAAYRTAVEWEEAGTVREGVFIRRRETSSWLNALVGGRGFPGIHHHARFHVRESANEFEVQLRSDDGVNDLLVRAHRTSQLPSASVFRSLAEASAFFLAGSLGYSATGDAGRFQGLELHCREWKVEPLAVDELRSSFFENKALFPPGTIAFDSAFLMRNIEHEWHGRPDLCHQRVNKAYLAQLSDCREFRGPSLLDGPAELEEQRVSRRQG